MSEHEYQPTPPAALEAQNQNEQWTLVFTRELRHSPESVWDALTDPDELREWAPFDPDRNLGTPGPATLTMAGGDEEKTPAMISRAERPHLLEYTWGTDLLRWELEPTSSGTRLTLRHTVESRPWLPKVAAGWHICFDTMDAYLSGRPVGRIVGPGAKQWWEPLNAEYARQLGVEDTGWPLPRPDFA